VVVGVTDDPAIRLMIRWLAYFDRLEKEDRELRLVLLRETWEVVRRTIPHNELVELISKEKKRGEL